MGWLSRQIGGLRCAPALTSSRSSSASPTARRTATFLVRQPRQVQGFREPLADGEALTDGLALTMIWIPPGRFWMGSPKTEPERAETEGPQHLVQLPGFFMGQTPITQGQWRAVARWQPPKGRGWERELDPEPSCFQPESEEKRSVPIRVGTFAFLEGETSTDQRPVEWVSWLDAMEFCRRLNSRLGAEAGRTYTLPSEAQWEYACRAGTTTPFAFGETLTSEVANYDASQIYENGTKGKVREQTTPVGMFPANAWGLHDMHGNVWEWCLDDWHDSYEGAPEDGSAWLLQGPGLDRGKGKGRQGNEIKSGGEGKETGDRLLRGGSWGVHPRGCRSAARGLFAPDDANDGVGFRVVCLPQGPSLNP
jgi:formylglycine-generating enzyme required for sulfatase activity